jgi:hypothetical protein
MTALLDDARADVDDAVRRRVDAERRCMEQRAFLAATEARTIECEAALADAEQAEHRARYEHRRIMERETAWAA